MTTLSFVARGTLHTRRNENPGTGLRKPLRPGGHQCEFACSHCSGNRSETFLFHRGGVLCSSAADLLPALCQLEARRITSFAM